MSNELIKLDENLPAELRAEINKELSDSLGQMMDGIDVQPIKIKIAAGGSNNWLVGKDEVAEKSFRGIIIVNTKAYAYWHKKDKPNPITLTLSDDTDLNRPICSSTDGIVGSEPPQIVKANGKEVTCFGNCGAGKKNASEYNSACGDCYLNYYGTAVDESGKPGKGKGCKNGRRMLILKEGSEIPHVLTLSPSSITNFDAYITKLRNKKTASWIVWTTFNLESKQDGPKKWSFFTPGQEERIPDEIVPKVYQFKKQFEAAVGIEITQDEFEGSHPNGAEEVVTDENGNVLF